MCAHFFVFTNIHLEVLHDHESNGRSFSLTIESGNVLVTSSSQRISAGSVSWEEEPLQLDTEDFFLLDSNTILTFMVLEQPRPGELLVMGLATIPLRDVHARSQLELDLRCVRRAMRAKLSMSVIAHGQSKDQKNALSTTPMGGEGIPDGCPNVWPITDTIIANAISRYVKKCQGLGMNPRLLKKYIKFLCRPESQVPGHAKTESPVPDVDPIELTKMHLRSPQRYYMRVRALLATEQELSSIEKTPLSSLCADVTWEQKLDLLQHVRQDEWAITGWKWNETEGDTRHLKHASDIKEQSRDEDIKRRLFSPTHTQAVASCIAYLVSRIAQSPCPTLPSSKGHQALYHPSLRFSHLTHLHVSTLRNGNCIDLNYVEAFLSNRGVLLPRRYNRINPSLSKMCAAHTHSTTGKGIFPTAMLSLKLAIRLPLTCAACAGLETRRSSGVWHGRESTKSLDPSDRQCLENHLLADVAKAAGLPKSRVALDELETVRQESEVKKRRRLESSSFREMRYREQSPNPKKQQLNKKKILLGWTHEHRNLVTAKFTIVDTTSSGAFAAATAVSKSASKATSQFRCFGTVSCCCLSGLAQTTQELRQRSWPQYWTFFVSPCFFGYKIRQLLESKQRTPKDQVCLKSTLWQRELNTYKAIGTSSKVGSTPLHFSSTVPLLREKPGETHPINFQEGPWWQRTRVQWRTPDHSSTARFKTRSTLLHTHFSNKGAIERFSAVTWRSKHADLWHWFSVLLSRDKRVLYGRGSEQPHLHREIEVALRWLYRETSANFTINQKSTNTAVLPKRELFVVLCQAPICSWAIRHPQCRVLAALLRLHEVAMAFLLMPVEQTGCISEDEFVAFGLIVSDLIPGLRRLQRHLFTHTKGLEQRPADHKARPTDDLIISHYNDKAESLCGQAHSHIFIHMNYTPEYCCICRRNSMKKSQMHNYALAQCGAKSNCPTNSTGKSKVARLLRALVENVVSREEKSKTILAMLDAIIHTIAIPCTSYALLTARAIKKLRISDLASMAQNPLRSRQPCVRLIEHAKVASSHSPDQLLSHTLIPNDAMLHPPKLLSTTLAFKLSQDRYDIPQLYAKGLPASEYRGRVIYVGETELTRLSTATRVSRTSSPKIAFDRDKWFLTQQPEGTQTGDVVPQRNKTVLCSFERARMSREELRTRGQREIMLRSLELPMRLKQEAAHRSLHMLAGGLTKRGQISLSLRRLNWIRGFSTRHVMRDSTSGDTHCVRLLFFQHGIYAQHAVSSAEDVCHLRCRNIVKILAAFSEQVDSFNLYGTCSQVGTLVTYVTPCPRFSLTEGMKTLGTSAYPQMVQTWAREIAQSLSAMHRDGISHQNINPTAFWLDDHGRMILDDLMFMEQVQTSIFSDSYDSKKADVWALGCCMYHWLTGILPSVHTQPACSVLKLIPHRFFGPMYHAIDLALQTCPEARASADDLVRVFSRGSGTV